MFHFKPKTDILNGKLCDHISTPLKIAKLTATSTAIAIARPRRLKSTLGRFRGLARTIADLEGATEIRDYHLHEATNFRMLDQDVWK